MASIVLKPIPIMDADYNIIYAHIGYQGRLSDGVLFQNTSFYNKKYKTSMK